MIHLRSIEIREGEEEIDDTGFPFGVPAISTFEPRALEHPVLFLVGENGSGKSTLIESLAMATWRTTIGAENAERDPTLAALRPLAQRLRLGWRRQTGRGFFLRAEDFFHFTRRTRGLVKEMGEQVDRFRGTRAEGYMRAQKQALITRYGGNLDELSHGESFMRLLDARIVPKGLYLLDEPEAALSPMRQLALLALLKQQVEQNECQFVIATHSPILMSYPGAEIWCFEDGRVAPRAFEQLEHVRFTRDFLTAPERYWRHL